LPFLDIKNQEWYFFVKAMNYIMKRFRAPNLKWYGLVGDSFCTLLLEFFLHGTSGCQKRIDGHLLRTSNLDFFLLVNVLLILFSVLPQMIDESSGTHAAILTERD
jgi:hypothetical protein